MKHKNENKLNRTTRNGSKSENKNTIPTYEMLVKDFYDGKNIKN